MRGGPGRTIVAVCCAVACGSSDNLGSSGAPGSGDGGASFGPCTGQALPSAGDACTGAGDGSGVTDGSLPPFDATGDGPTVCGSVTSDPKNCGRCGHDCLGGACQGGLCQPVVLATGQPASQCLAVDGVNVYWTNEGAGGSVPPTGTVMKVAIGGGAPVTLASGLDWPLGVASDGASVYWIEGITSSALLKKVPVGGGSPTVVASVAAGGSSSVAVDAQRIYWVDSAGIKSVPLAGGAPTLLAPDASANYLAIDATSVYWLDSPSGQCLVKKVPLAGGTAPVTLASVNQSCITSHIQVGAGSVYWMTGAVQGNATLLGVPVGGGSTLSLESYMTVWIPLIGVDTAHVYWWEAGGLEMAPPAGGIPTTLLAQSTDDAGYPVYRPNSMVLDATSLYWVTAGGTGKGNVMRLAKP